MAVAPRREPLVDRLFETDREEEVTDEDETDGVIPEVEAVAMEALDMARDNEMGV